MKGEKIDAAINLAELIKMVANLTQLLYGILICLIEGGAVRSKQDEGVVFKGVALDRMQLSRLVMFVSLKTEGMSLSDSRQTHVGFIFGCEAVQ